MDEKIKALLVGVNLNDDPDFENALKELESLAEEMSRTFDPARRQELAVEMQQVILEDHAFVFASHLRMSMISKASVTGLTAHPCDYYEITADLDISV